MDILTQIIIQLMKNQAMIETVNKGNYFNGLVALYHLLINADGKIEDKEVQMGEFMRKHENIDDYEFSYYLKKFAGYSKEEALEKCISSLKQCDFQWRLKCIAWMSLIANSNGFMDPEEWRLLYRVYSTELHLKLEDILATQRNLPKPL